MSPRKDNGVPNTLTLSKNSAAAPLAPISGGQGLSIVNLSWLFMTITSQWSDSVKGSFVAKSTIQCLPFSLGQGVGVG